MQAMMRHLAAHAQAGTQGRAAAAQKRMTPTLAAYSHLP
jgi:hypothetical protein